MTNYAPNQPRNKPTLAGVVSLHLAKPDRLFEGFHEPNLR